MSINAPNPKASEQCGAVPASPGRCSPIVLGALYLMVVVSVAVGVYARQQQFIYSDPLRLSTDLNGTFQIWTDLTGELGRAPSRRMGEYGLAILLGLIGGVTGHDQAHSLQLLALLCSLGMIGAGAAFVYSIHGEVLPAAIAAAVVAVSAPVIERTIVATSTPPFLFFCTCGAASFFLYWRTGKVRRLIAGSLLLALACAIRGTGLLHLALLGAGLAAMCLLPTADRAQCRGRLIAVALALGTSLLAFSVGKTLVMGHTVTRYKARDGQTPVLKPYTPYVVFDGLMHGPYRVDQEGWEQRERLYRDPTLQNQNPIVRGDSTAKIIWNHRTRYLSNYVQGVVMTLWKLLSDPTMNLVTGLPWVAGLALLAYRKQWNPVLAIGSWVSVYLLLVPMIALIERTVWPVFVGVLALSAYGLASAYTWLAGGRRIWHRGLCVFALAATGVFLWDAGREAIRFGTTPFTDINRVVRDHIPDLPDRPTRVMAMRNVFCNYGKPLTHLNANPSSREEDQLRLLAETRPDVVYLRDFARAGLYQEPFAVLARLLRRQQSEQRNWVQTWSDGKCELWERSSLPHRFSRSSRVLLRIDDPSAGTTGESPAPDKPGAKPRPLELRLSDPDNPAAPPATPLPEGDIVLRIDVTSTADASLRVEAKGGPDSRSREVPRRHLVTGRNELFLELPAGWDGTLRIVPENSEASCEFHRVEVRALPK